MAQLSPPPGATVCVLLTPRALGGHELALLAWLADAVHTGGLRPAIVAPTPALVQACAARGLSAWLWPAGPAGPGDATGNPYRTLLRCLRTWPADRPLLLAPGVLHAGAWLLAAAVLLRRAVWVYVPMAYSARHMGLRHATLRDRLLAPWLRQVRAWVTLDDRQAGWLTGHWRVSAPVHRLPNLARVAGDGPRPPAPGADGRLRVAVVGRFDAHQKGLDWLAGVLRARPGWSGPCTWRFQGRGPAERLLLELAADLGPHRVQVHGHAPLDEALAVCDVLVLVSRFEGLPLVALEATARGWPVVASHESGLAGQLPDRALFHFGDAAGLAQALSHLRTADARAQAAAQARARQHAGRPDQRYRAALQHLVRALQAPASAHPAAAC